MALVRVPAADQTITEPEAICTFLAARGIDYEHVHPDAPIGPETPAAEVLAAYKDKIDELSAKGGYVTADENTRDWGMVR